MRPNLYSACLDEIDMTLFSSTSLNLVEFADPAPVGHNRPLVMPAKFSIIKFGEWQLFRKQIDFMTAPLQPIADCCVMVSDDSIGMDIRLPV
jgi:hypothetical protein